MVAKELERYDVGSKQSTVNVQNALNVTVDIASVIPQGGQNCNE